MLFEPRSQRCRRIIIRKKVLDGREPIARRSAKAVEKVVFRLHHGQVGGKARHGIPFVDLLMDLLWCTLSPGASRRSGPARNARQNNALSRPHGEWSSATSQRAPE
jgi:hypothetical protein